MASPGWAGEPLFLALLAETHRAAGRLDDAWGDVEAAFALSEQKQQPFWDAELHRLKAELLLERDPGAKEPAKDLLRKAIEIAQQQEAKSLELRAATSLARLWHAQGRKNEARALLAPVYDWFTEGFDTQDLKDAKALLDELT